MKNKPISFWEMNRYEILALYWPFIIVFPTNFAYLIWCLRLVYEEKIYTLKGGWFLFYLFFPFFSQFFILALSYFSFRKLSLKRKSKLEEQQTFVQLLLILVASIGFFIPPFILLISQSLKVARVWKF